MARIVFVWIAAVALTAGVAQAADGDVGGACLPDDTCTTGDAAACKTLCCDVGPDADDECSACDDTGACSACTDGHALDANGACLASNGEACEADGDCASSSCDTTTCAPVDAHGVTGCGADAECVSDNCVFTVDADPECVGKAAGTVCAGEAECALATAACKTTCCTEAASDDAECDSCNNVTGACETCGNATHYEVDSETGTCVGIPCTTAADCSDHATAVDGTLVTGCNCTCTAEFTGDDCNTTVTVAAVADDSSSSSAEPVDPSSGSGEPTDPSTTSGSVAAASLRSAGVATAACAILALFAA